MADSKKEVMPETELNSLEEWANSWGEGPNWSDETGRTIPVVRDQLKLLIHSCQQARKEAADWKRRAEQHGCDVVNGDPDCG